MILVISAVLSAGCASPFDAENAMRDRLRRRSPTETTRGPSAEPPQSPASDNEKRDFELPEEPTLEDYRRYALEHSDALREAFHEWKAAIERVPQARSLPDPKVSYSYFVRESMKQQSVGVMQTLLDRGKLKARGAAALERARAAEQRVRAQKLETLAEVEKAYADYAFLHEALAVLEQQRQIAVSLKEAARAQVEAGEAPVADLINAEIRVAEIEDKIESRKARRPALQGRLNAAIGRAPEKSLPWPRPLQVAKLDEKLKSLRKALARANPEIAALGHESASRRHALREARRNRIPDLTLGVQFMEMVPANRQNQVAITGSINLPIYGERLEAERAEALAELGAAMRRRRQRKRALGAELEAAWFAFKDTRRSFKLYDERLVPKARKAMEASEGAYRADELSFRDLAKAQAELERLELERRRHRARLLKKKAEIKRLTGRTGGARPRDREPAKP